MTAEGSYFFALPEGPGTETESWLGQWGEGRGFPPTLSFSPPLPPSSSLSFLPSLLPPFILSVPFPLLHPLQGLPKYHPCYRYHTNAEDKEILEKSHP